MPNSLRRRVFAAEPPRGTRVLHDDSPPPCIDSCVSGFFVDCDSRKVPPLKLPAWNFDTPGFFDADDSRFTVPREVSSVDPIGIDFACVSLTKPDPAPRSPSCRARNADVPFGSLTFTVPFTGRTPALSPITGANGTPDHVI